MVNIMKSICALLVVILLFAGCDANSNSDNIVNIVNQGADNEVVSHNNEVNSFVQGGQFEQNDINWAQPACFILKDRIYYARFYNGYESALAELPKNYSVHGNLDKSNFPSDEPQYNIEFLEGLDYYYDPEDLSVVYVYQNCFLYGYREEYRYVPYIIEDRVN